MSNDNEQWYAQNRDEANKLLDESDALKKKANALLHEAKRKEEMAMDYKARADKIKAKIIEARGNQPHGLDDDEYIKSNLRENWS